MFFDRNVATNGFVVRIDILPILPKGIHSPLHVGVDLGPPIAFFLGHLHGLVE